MLRAFGAAPVPPNGHVQTEDEHKAWTEGTAPVWAPFEPQIGKELIARVRSYSK